MTRYVVGFLFDQTGKEVALIRKNRPAWQENKLNGIGGHIEDGETPAQAMAREFLEETGVDIAYKDWEQFAAMRGLDWEIYCYRAFSTLVYEVDTKTDEKVEIFTVCEVLQNPTMIKNLTWLLPLALDDSTSASYSVHGSLRKAA